MGFFFSTANGSPLLVVVPLPGTLLATLASTPKYHQVVRTSTRVASYVASFTSPFRQSSYCYCTSLEHPVNQKLLYQVQIAYEHK